MNASDWCEKPDRDIPRLTCGHPLPCPYHTVTIDLSAEPHTIIEPITANISSKARARLRRIAKAVKP